MSDAENEPAIDSAPAPASGRWSAWKQKQALLDIASFVFSLALAFVFRWRAGDLVWSLWLSSLVLGSVMFVAWLAPIAWNDIPSRFGAMPLLKRITAPINTLVRLVLPLTLLFALFYLGSHLLYSVFLNHSLPLIDGQGEPSWAMYPAIWHSYWLFLPIAFFREHRAFLSLFRRNNPDESAQTSFWKERVHNLLKTHILIFVLALLPFGRADSFLAYAAVSVVYFFPWELLIKPTAKSKTDWSESVALAKQKTAEKMAAERRNKQSIIPKHKR